MNATKTVGIDDVSAYLPTLFLPIEDLARARGIEYAKLSKGLGLQAMAVADVHEDVATMAANAVLQLMRKNELQPASVGRIYLGTESSLDGSKPMASYVLDMLGRYYEGEAGPDAFLNCDAVDLTFACIGAVDALENALDWVRGGAGRQAIVVASDVARYELGSPGEYTQGAGAVSLLVKEAPRLLVVESPWGVATRGVHDFFKPYRHVDKAEMITAILREAGLSEEEALRTAALLKDREAMNALFSPEDDLWIHRDVPVFDGPYSNDCYRQRIREAFAHWNRQRGGEAGLDRWERLICHLPYAFQARRMFPELFWENAVDDLKTEILKNNELSEPQSALFSSREEWEKAYSAFLKKLGKTPEYRAFAARRLEPAERYSSQVGNVYTGSIFLALMSSLRAAAEAGEDLSGSPLGFFAYGSGSKSKVFEGVVQPAWSSVVQGFEVERRLQQRRAISFGTYEKLHLGKLSKSILPPADSFYLQGIEREKGVREGARRYAFGPEAKVEEKV